MRIRHVALLGLILLLTVSIRAQERIVLSALIVTPDISDYRPGSLFLQVDPTPHIAAMIVANTNERLSFAYPCTNGCATDTGVETRALIEALNTANLSTRSLWRRLFDRVVADFPEKFPSGATVQ